MAGCAIADLMDAFSDDETSIEKSPLADAEDYMRRALQMASARPKSLAKSLAKSSLTFCQQSFLALRSMANHMLFSEDDHHHLCWKVQSQPL